MFHFFTRIINKNNKRMKESSAPQFFPPCACTIRQVFTGVLRCCGGRCCCCCCFGFLVNNERTQHRGSKHGVRQPQAERDREAVVSRPPSLSNTCFSHPFSALVYSLVHIFDNSCSTFPNIYLFFL